MERPESAGSAGPPESNLGGQLWNSKATANGGITLDLVRQQLARILASRTFATSERHQRFLEYTVSRALVCQTEDLKEYSVGVEVFERPVDFDPRIDAVVRVEAHRLRARLKKYYETEGAADPVIVEFPASGYVPSFRRRELIQPGQQETATKAGSQAARNQSKSPFQRRNLAIVLAGAAVVVLGYWSVNRWTRHVEETRRFSILSGDGSGLRLGSLDHYPVIAISPDGRTVAYTGRDNKDSRLYLRKLDEFEEKPIEGSTRGTRPFFSPDGKWLAFFEGRRLLKVAVTGGSPIVICECDGHGGTWSEDGTIVIGGNPNVGLRRVSEGGRVSDLTRLNREAGERAHGWPHFLPGGDSLIYGAWLGGGFDQTPIYMYSLKTGRQQRIGFGSSPVYARSGHLLFARDTNLLAASFDPRTGATGPEIEAQPGVAWGGICGVSHFALSSNGTLVFATPSHEDERQIAWAGPGQSMKPIIADRREFHHARLSPDGNRIAVSVHEQGRYSIWTLELSNKTWRKITTGPHQSFYPIWSPDGHWLAYVDDRDGRYSLFRQRVDGTGAAEPMSASTDLQTPLSWAPDGSGLLYLNSVDGGRMDIFWLPLNNAAKPVPFLATKHQEVAAQFSPDGRWVAFVSNQSGRPEVYVTRFSDPQKHCQVSQNGGRTPVWFAQDEIVYQTPNALVAVHVRLDPAPRISPPREMLAANLADTVFPYLTNFDADRRNKRLLVLQRATDPKGSSLNAVTSWLSTLSK